MNIKIIKDKLYHYGIRGPVNEWLISFLSERKLVVEVESVRSSPCSVDIGVPQGSILGPLIFLLFINDLSSHITRGNTYIYADDTTVIVEGDSVADLRDGIDTVIGQFTAWCEGNLIILNTQKTVLMEFINRRQKTHISDYQFDGVVLECSTDARFLGIVVDRHLSWSQQINGVCKRLNGALYALTVLKKSLGSKAILSYYYASVYSILNYGVILWGQSLEWEQVFITQKRIIRLMFDLPYRTSCRGTFIKHKIFTLVSIYLFRILKYIHSNKKCFLKHKDVHTHDTRNSGKLYIERAQHSFLFRSPIHSGCKIYNILPEQITNLSDVKFMKTLRAVLTENAFYSVNEFVEHVKAMA